MTILTILTIVTGDREDCDDREVSGPLLARRVLTSEGVVLSVAHAKQRSVLSPSEFDSIELGVLRHVGVLFVKTLSSYLNARVVSGASRLGQVSLPRCAPPLHASVVVFTTQASRLQALEAAVKQAATPGDLPREACLALRSLLVRRCSIGAINISGEITARSSASLADVSDAVQSPLPLPELPSPPRSSIEIDGDEAASQRQGHRLALTLGTLRRLPVFDTLSQRRCVALTSHGVICAPADGSDRWQRSSSWDMELEPVLGDELLRLQDEEEVALLREPRRLQTHGCRTTPSRQLQNSFH